MGLFLMKIKEIKINMKDKKRIAVFASGYGSNLQAIIDYSQKKDISN